MDENRRNLPSWMLRSEKKPSAGASLSDKTTRRRPVKRETVYCMNEAELVETALSVLKETKHRDHAVVTQAVQRYSVARAEDTVGKRKLAEPSSSDEEDESSESQEDKRNYVSETDLEGVAEEETLPYTDTSERDRSVKPEVPPQPTDKGLGVTEPTEVDSAGGASDDEGLQLLREIFFK